MKRKLLDLHGYGESAFHDAGDASNAATTDQCRASCRPDGTGPAGGASDAAQLIVVRRIHLLRDVKLTLCKLSPAG